MVFALLIVKPNISFYDRIPYLQNLHRCHNWFGGKKVLIPVSDIKEVQWDQSKVIVNITTDAVKSSKLFNESEFMHMESNML